MPRRAQAVMCGCLLGTLVSGAPAAETPQPLAPNPAAPELPALPAATEPLSEVVVETNEPKFVAPTRRDRIGRIWAPVLIDGKGPYRLVLDTGANRSAVTVRTAQNLGMLPSTASGSPPSATMADTATATAVSTPTPTAVSTPTATAAGMPIVTPVSTTRVTGFTGSAVVPTIHVERLEVGDLLMGPQDLPVLPDVFGGAQGVLGLEGLTNKRIYADFTRDVLEIASSHGQPAQRGFATVPLKMIGGGLLVAEVRVGMIRAKAIVDTGAQGTIGNLALRDALMRHPPHNAKREDIIGVTLAVQSGDDIPAPDIDFGHMTVRGVHIIFGDMYLFQHWKLTGEPALTLGMDLLGSFDVLIIDYHRHELQIRLRESYSQLH